VSIHYIFSLVYRPVNVATAVIWVLVKVTGVQALRCWRSRLLGHQTDLPVGCYLLCCWPSKYMAFPAHRPEKRGWFESVYYLLVSLILWKFRSVSR